MAKDPLLRDAVRAIKAKIESAAASATPEELAYLGTAIDRIGGRATILEIEAMGDIKMEEFLAHANAVERATLNAIAATADQAMTNVKATQTAVEASLSKTKDAALAAMAETETGTIAKVNAAAQTAVQQAAAAAGSVTQQLVLGRKSFFLAQL